MQTARRFDHGADNDRYGVKNKKSEKFRVVKNNEALFKSQKKLMFKALFMVAILLVVGVSFTAYGTSVKYQINETNAAIAELQTEIDDLNLQVTTNMSPEVIESKAVAELGMEYPSSSQYVYINSGTGTVYTASAE
ncbi:MAG: cell division protein FtsL [Firmicutes bacterium]|nr:cell division protein FtsL [Bacillota bacterium]